MSDRGATKKPSCAGSALSVRRTIGFTIYRRNRDKVCYQKIVKNLSRCRKYILSQGNTKKAEQKALLLW